MIKFLLLILLSVPSFAGVHITSGKQEIGDERIKLKPKDFKITLNAPIPNKIKVKLIKNSIQWVRVEGVLLLPRARLAVYIQGKSEQFFLRYGDSTIQFQQRKKYAYTELYVSLFGKEKVYLHHKGKKAGIIDINLKKRKKNNLLVDYSCSRRNIVVTGLDDELLSLGCRISRIGDFGKETPMMEVLWSSPNWTLADGQHEDFHKAIFLDSEPSKAVIVNTRTKEERVLTIEAGVPKRLHRLNTAYGFGPYAFVTTFKEDPDAPDDEFESISKPMTPALMLYFNFKLSEGASVRGFDALVFHDSIFNNLGVYFANDVALVMDKKFVITTLIGMQHLYFKFDDSSPVISEPIFPQGVEFLWKHVFDIENYIISGGLFLSPSENIDYQNIWIRWGKNYFWELNYIYWGKEQFSAEMWGVSLGLPLKGFL